MNSIRLLAAVACAALASPSFAVAFSNNWSFVDQLSGETVSGVVHGLENGTNLSADGLIVTVTQAPYPVMLGDYTLDLGANSGDPTIPDVYSAANGVVTFANFLYSDEAGQKLQFGTNPGAGSRYPELTSDSGVFAYDDAVGMQFSAVTTSVPEPASWAMMIGGFGLIGAHMRRRTRVSFA